MNRSPWTVKLEQFRQAKRIHGGLLQLSVAALGIKLSRLPIPTRRLRMSVYRNVFHKKYPPGLDEDEAEKPLWAYPSINAVFTRGLKPACRPIAADTPQFLSPCDGTVQEVGRVEQGKILTLKGIEYTLDSLLPQTDTRPFEGGHFTIIFLSPLDCHRVFSPQDGLLEKAVHVPGYRLLVHPPYQRRPSVYTLNERMILRLSTPLGPCLLVMVAGWGVGNITLPLLPRFWPRKGGGAVQKTCSPAPAVKRGDWIATFELGSTVMLLTPAAAAVMPLISPNDKVKYGQPVFTYPG